MLILLLFAAAAELAYGLHPEVISDPKALHAKAMATQHFHRGSGVKHPSSHFVRAVHLAGLDMQPLSTASAGDGCKGRGSRADGRPKHRRVVLMAMANEVRQNKVPFCHEYAVCMMPDLWCMAVCMVAKKLSSTWVAEYAW